MLSCGKAGCVCSQKHLFYKCSHTVVFTEQQGCSQSCYNRDPEPQPKLRRQVGNEGDRFWCLGCLWIRHSESALGSASAVRITRTCTSVFSCPRAVQVMRALYKTAIKKQASRKNIRTPLRSLRIRTSCQRRKRIIETEEPFPAEQHGNKQTPKTDCLWLLFTRPLKIALRKQHRSPIFS